MRNGAQLTEGENMQMIFNLIKQQQRANVQETAQQSG